MIGREKLDALVVSTPDHTHAVATAAGLHNGLHVYCEKPLTRTVSECRAVTELARRKKLVTQMGTQIHAGDNYRRVVELLRAGAIGSVKEVHVWVGSNMGGASRGNAKHKVPASLDYDLWLGPTRYHVPYHPTHHPFSWRQWWDFAGGSLADLGCHHIDLSHWALGLKHPNRIEVVKGPKPDAEATPYSLVVNFHYKAHGKQPATKLCWYHGKHRPPHFAEGLLPKWGNGSLFVGNNGMLLADYDKHVLLPEKDFRDYERPEPSIPRSLGHHREWIHAIKTGSATTCNFDYAGPLAEVVLLGNIAHRTGAALEWNHGEMKLTGHPEAAELMQHIYRAGWQL
jgi:predicted dehydrogenase